MKKTLMFATLFVAALCSQGQVADPDSTGLPGDHFSLRAALDLFKKSESPEDFEKKLNSESNHINNLDINGDGKIDYIRVVDHSTESVHALTLQVPVNGKESQDIAVIEIEKTGEESAQLQIVGDVELYGVNVYAEPVDEKAEGGKGGPDAPMETVGIIVNVWMWPCVRYIYVPAYNPWISPWYWDNYPGWWSPWRPYGWYSYWGYCRPYHVHYHIVHVHRCERARDVYYGHRSVSPVVQNRYKKEHARLKEARKADKVKQDDAVKKNDGKERAPSKEKVNRNDSRERKQKVERNQPTPGREKKVAPRQERKKSSPPKSPSPGKSGGKRGRK